MKKIVTIVVVLAVAAFAIFRLVTGHQRINSKKTTEYSNAITVTVDTVKLDKVNRTITMVGNLAASKELSIAAEMQGKITSLDVEVGQDKQRGEVIATVDNKLRQLAVEKARVNFEKSKRDLERYENLLAGGSITQQQLDDARDTHENNRIALENAQKELSNSVVTAPINGTITEKKTELGAYVSPGTPLAYIVDVATLKVKVNASEANVYALKVGDRVDIRSDVYPGVTFNGRITFVSPQGDDAHNYPVEIELNNSGRHNLKAGTFVNVSVSVPSGGDMPCIPRSSLLGSTKNASVYVAKDGVARIRPVVISGQSEDNLIVSDGLGPGEIVVTSGQVNLSDGKAIQIERN